MSRLILENINYQKLLIPFLYNKIFRYEIRSLNFQTKFTFSLVHNYALCIYFCMISSFVGSLYCMFAMVGVF